MYRRHFLAALTAPGLLPALDRFDLSRIAMLTDEVAKSPADAIAFCKQYGFQNVELRGVPGGRGHYGSLPVATLREAAKEFADNGLKVTFLNTPFFKITLPGTEPLSRRPETPEAREKRIARHQAEFDGRHEGFKRAMENAHILGVDKMRVFTFLRVAEPGSVFQRIADVLGEMSELAAKEKISLLVENEGACNVVTCAETADFLKLMPQKNFGLNWDPWNGLAQKEKPFPEGYALLPKGRIWNVQMKGHALLDAERKLPWRQIFAQLTKDGYDGYAGLETHYFDGTLIEKSHLTAQEIRRILSS
ncbi:MAG TPA: sugar phosphate isomerase/epimerase family protein [Bryobacteraceae bacterium]|nr:sugar phosphate isomerase/epimerase family protein [Bryobacteraceae bacterium]